MSVQTISPENRLYSIKVKIFLMHSKNILNYDFVTKWTYIFQVTQLTSSDDLAAPTGCLQYFTEGEGILASFNYRDKSEIGIPRVPSYLVSIKEPELNKLYKFPWFLDHGQSKKRGQTSYYYYLLIGGGPPWTTLFRNGNYLLHPGEKGVDEEKRMASIPIRHIALV